MYKANIFYNIPSRYFRSDISHQIMVERLKPDELAAFKEAFDSFDRNNDGTIGTKVRCIPIGIFNKIYDKVYYYLYK